MGGDIITEEAPSPPPPSFSNGCRFAKHGRRAEDERLDEDGVETATSAEQRRVEESVLEAYRQKRSGGGAGLGGGDAATATDDHPPLLLLRERHAAYLTRALTRGLDSAYSGLDASRPWLVYWMVHGLELLGRPVTGRLASDVCRFLARCQSPRDGGFGGGPGQLAHLAPTYAAVAALCALGTRQAYETIDRPGLLRFLRRMRQPDGSFALHAGGEADARGAYCAAAVASLVFPGASLGSLLFEGTAAWLGRCQGWEGGLGGAPGLEAHGGYTYCGVAALTVLLQGGEDEERTIPALLDLEALRRWAAGRQMRCEGGFQGRCNKLVDGCYSFWQGATLALIHPGGGLGVGQGLDGGGLGLREGLGRGAGNGFREESDLTEEEEEDESTLSSDQRAFVTEFDLSRDNTAFGDEKEDPFVEDGFDPSRDKTFVETLSNGKTVFLHDGSKPRRHKAVFGDEKKTEFNPSCEKNISVDECNLSSDKTVFLRDECGLSSDGTLSVEETNLSSDRTFVLPEESEPSGDRTVLVGGESDSSRDKTAVEKIAFVEEDEFNPSRHGTAAVDRSDASPDKTFSLQGERHFSSNKTISVEDECESRSDETLFREDQSDSSSDQRLQDESKSNRRHKADFPPAESNPVPQDHPGCPPSSDQRCLFDQEALQEYILLCCQDPAGGLLDKPGKAPDFYHTCYCLSGLSLAQHCGEGVVVVGGEGNRLARTHPVYNISPQKVARARRYFQRLPPVVPAEPEPESSDLAAAADADEDPFGFTWWSEGPPAS